MRLSVAVLGGLVVVLAALTTSSSADLGELDWKPPTALSYQWQEGMGTAAIVGAVGRSIQIIDRLGNPAFEGMVHEDFFVFDCPNAGRDETGVVVRVLLDGVMHCEVDRDGDWYWD